MIRVLFDTETTGLLKPSARDVSEQPEIVEIYAVMIGDDYNPIGEFDTLIKPKIPISDELTKIHGISNEMVADAPTFEEIYPAFAKFMTGADELIGHNLPFDRSMVANELIRIDRLIQFPWPRFNTCTVEMSMPIEQRRLNLSKLHEYATGKPHEGAHRAKADVHALVRCYFWMMEEVVDGMVLRKEHPF